jgi:hypothetical protein
MVFSRSTLSAPALVLLAAATLHGQSLPSAPLPSAPGTAPQQQSQAPAEAPSRPVAASLRPYTGCATPAGTSLTSLITLPETPMTRTAETIKGSRPIKLLDGAGVTYAFAQGNFVNAKFELLPAATYTTEKADLIAEWEKILYTGDDTERNLVLKPTMAGFPIQGFDRKALDGQVLGIYLLFDDTHHTATTLYFLNQEPKHRNFATLSEYRQLRDRFLYDLTKCVRSKLDEAARARPAAPVRR